MRAGIAIAITAVIIGLAFGPAGLQVVGQQFASGHLHPPRLELIAQAPLVIQLHLATVLGAFAVATILMLGVKGTLLHRTLGWAVSILLVFTAIDALFIHGPSGPQISPLHLFSVVTLVFVPYGVLAARRRKVLPHRRTMTGLYFGAFIVAGLIAFMPGRLMWRVFFG